MRRTPLHPLAAFLCLIAFGICNTLLAGGGIMCRSAEGAHVTLAAAHPHDCEDHHGRHAADCASTPGEQEPRVSASCSHQCEDSPVTNHLPTVSRAGKVAASLVTEPLPLLSVFAFAHLWAVLPEPTSCSASQRLNTLPVRPAGEMVCLRTVVIRV